jgi:16S rRNA (cytidine1402-2'-O)-methyltransferase
MAAKVYLIPSILSEEKVSPPITIPGYIQNITGQLRYFVVEEEREGRRFLKQLSPQLPLPECTFFVVNEHSSAQDIKDIFTRVAGHDFGIVSDAGCPCVADPGAELVALAHQHNLQVVPLVGPSSIILALMASGLNGQSFAFNGYLPKERDERIKKIKSLEKRSLTEHQSQIFMDTPYRNQHVFDDILSSCHPQTLLSVAVDLTGKEEYIKTLPVKGWIKAAVALPKKPALFIIQQPSFA